MNIGDTVRLLRGSEEGKITRFLENNLIEIEIEDGFAIPVLKNEVVVIAQEEKNYFHREEITPEPPRPSREEVKKAKAKQGIYLAYVQINDKQLSAHLLNTTDFDLLFTAGEEAGDSMKGLASGVLKSQESTKITDAQVSDFDAWPALVFQILFFQRGNYTPREPLIRKLKFKAATFFKSKATAPILQKPAFLFSISDTGARQGGKSIDISSLKEGMFAPQEKSDVKNQLTLERPPRQVDLHIEQLTTQADSMNNAEMLELQLRTFEEKLDQAIATGMDEIIFIHGVGSGVLRNTIQKKLSSLHNIQYFQDTQREKFGYGATLVRIK